MALVEPAFDFILSIPDAFSPGKEATELLFTDKFPEMMLKEASQDATLASTSATRARAKAGGKKVTAHPDQSTRVLRPRRGDPAHFPVVGRGQPSGAKSWM